MLVLLIAIAVLGVPGLQESQGIKCHVGASPHRLGLAGTRASLPWDLPIFGRANATRDAWPVDMWGGHVGSKWLAEVRFANHIDALLKAPELRIHGVSLRLPGRVVRHLPVGA
jgi:hypothetical protein